MKRNLSPNGAQSQSPGLAGKPRFLRLARLPREEGECRPTLKGLWQTQPFQGA